MSLDVMRSGNDSRGEGNEFPPSSGHTSSVKGDLGPRSRSLLYPLPYMPSVQTFQAASSSSTFPPKRATHQCAPRPPKNSYESYSSEEDKTTRVFDLDACLPAQGSSGEEKVKSSSCTAATTTTTSTTTTTTAGGCCDQTGLIFQRNSTFPVNRDPLRFCSQNGSSSRLYT